MSPNPLPLPLQETFRRKKVFNDKGVEVDLHSNISEEEALLLYNKVRECKARVSAEIGFAQGVSTQAILKALEDNGCGHHHVIDPFQDNFENVGLAMANRCGLSHRLTFHKKFAEEIIPNLPLLDFAFIDSSHLFDLTICEFVLIDKKLRVGGVIGFHDMWMPSLQSAFRYIISNRNYTVLNSTSPNGKTGFKSFIKRLLGLSPYGTRFLNQDLLLPWRDLGIPNLVFLKKEADDNRDWRFHARF